VYLRRLNFAFLDYTVYVPQIKHGSATHLYERYSPLGDPTIESIDTEASVFGEFSYVD
jgi:hypothetical protein